MHPDRRAAGLPTVDFVVGEDEREDLGSGADAGPAGGAEPGQPPDAGEELSGGHARAGSPLTRNLLLGVVVLAGFALVARGVTRDGAGHPSAAPDPTPASVAAPLPAPVPDPDPPTMSLIAPSWHPSADVSVTGGTDGCPAHETCTQTGRLPDATAAALRTAFPHITITSSTTLLSGGANRAVLRRTVAAQDGSTDIVVDMRTYRKGDPFGSHIQVSGSRITTYSQGQAGGCTITIVVSRADSSSPQALTPLALLAADPDMSVPQ